MTQQAHDDDPFECDLPGCERTAIFEPVDDEAWPTEPPPGWYSVVVARNGVQNVTLMYCSQDHLGQGVVEHLPSSVALPDSTGGWRSNATVGIFLISYLTVLVLGLITAGAFLLDLARWLSNRF